MECDKQPKINISGSNSVGRMRDLGSRCRGFESRLSDHKTHTAIFKDTIFMLSVQVRLCQPLI